MENVAPSVDSLLESLFNDKGPSDSGSDSKLVGTDVGPLVEKLSRCWEGTKDIPIDLRTATFINDDGGMWIILPEGSPCKRIDFKRDSSNTRDPKVTLALRQFCRMLGVPHAFFVGNRPAMREAIVHTWQAGLESNDKRAKCVARVRQVGTVTVLRAILPERAVPPKACDIVRSVWEAYNDKVTLLFSHGDEKDDLVLHARFIFNEEFSVGGMDLRTGFDLVFSELGASPMSVDSLIYDVGSKVSYIASYGGEPFFSSNYEGLQPKDVAALFPALLCRIQSESAEFSSMISAAVSKKVHSANQECISLVRTPKFSASMRKAVFHEMAQSSDIETRMDVARHIALVAKDFESLKGVILERVAGRYLNLCFSRSLPDSKKETENVGKQENADET